ncbi:GTPase ObgE [Larkinella sp. VNQ87]|uniref:GTPase ObgE n=1 Tax=Larkinella sp. VNQ87 TaxID=3400921 RepID=UPI003C0984F2
MASSNFIDYVKINVRSGAGGAGSMHFRREKHVDKGGPDGGDGGRGGHIILKGSSQLWTLLHLKYQKHIKAKPGKAGEGGRRTGAEGDDVIIEVPLGTVARHAETGEQLAEITEDGQQIILLHGGRGGLGNDHFKSSTRQTPDYAQPGEPGQEAWVILELKLLADVGLVGFPNAGKSTLLSVVSAAKPEIADYPFTTLVPQLGVVAYRDYKSFVMADIPGIIEGASQGKGLGLRFLRHIERNSILLFVVPATSEDCGAEYETLLNELRLYNPELLDKQCLLAISKMDLISEEEDAQLRKRLPAQVPTVFISAVQQQGLTELKDLLWQALTKPEDDV